MLDGQQEVQDLRLTREESAVNKIVGIETEAYYWLRGKADGTICRLDLDYVSTLSPARSPLKKLVLALSDFCLGTPSAKPQPN